MPVIVFASSKGGVGKSTTALAFAQTLHWSKYSVHLLDADPNGPMRAWQKLTEAQGTLPNNFKVFSGLSETNIIEQIQTSAESSQFVIVDLEGSANLAVSYAINEADLVLIPCQGSQLDANEAAKIISTINRSEKQMRRKIPFAVCFTRTTYVKSRTNKHIFRLFGEQNIPTIEVEVAERDAFKALFTFGGMLHQLTQDEVSSPEKAILNMNEFCRAAIAFLKENQNV